MSGESPSTVPVQPVGFRSLDGLRLAGTYVAPTTPPTSVAVLVHGGGVTREEGGFFTRLADGLAAGGVASLRFDLRGHGESDGRQEELTIAGVLNDIHAALAQVRTLASPAPVHLLGASFGGGICGFYAARNPGAVAKLVLVNPLINYKKRFIDDKPYWTDDRIDENAGLQLQQQVFCRTRRRSSWAARY